MTRNGKIDRRNLPKTGGARPEINTAFVAPRNATEPGIQTIWEQKPGFEGIGVHDGFLELGGDSPVAEPVAVALQQEFGVEIPVANHCYHPTIAELAAYLSEVSGAE
jgi:hypothetical protein